MPRKPKRSSPGALAFEARKLEQRRTTIERVTRIATMMARAAWVPRLHGMELAREWGISYGAVRRYSAMASLQLGGGKTQDAIEEEREVAVARLQVLSVKAEAKGELRTAVEATAMAAKLSGVAYAPIAHRLVVVGNDGRPTPQAEGVLRSVPRAALDAAFAHLRHHPEDFEGARVRGLEAAHRVAISTMVEVAASEVSQGASAPGIIELPPLDDLADITEEDECQ